MTFPSQPSSLSAPKAWLHRQFTQECPVWHQGWELPAAPSSGAERFKTRSPVIILLQLTTGWKVEQGIRGKGGNYGGATGRQGWELGRESRRSKYVCAHMLGEGLGRSDFTPPPAVFPPTLLLSHHPVLRGQGGSPTSPSRRLRRPSSSICPGTSRWGWLIMVVVVGRGTRRLFFPGVAEAARVHARQL